jgi:hypothetical protein
LRRNFPHSHSPAYLIELIWFFLFHGVLPMFGMGLAYTKTRPDRADSARGQAKIKISTEEAQCQFKRNP